MDEILKKIVEETEKNRPQSITEEKNLEILKNIAEKNMTPGRALGFNESFFEMVYTFGYNLYKSGKYDQASEIFRVLTFFEPQNHKYLMGLASSFHLQKIYQSAVEAYIAASVLDQKDPMCLYYASDCFLKLKNIPGALLMLQMMLNRMGNNNKYSVLKERVAQSIKSLEKENIPVTTEFKLKLEE